MESETRGTLWRQFGAAIDMLENAVRACPEELWEREGFWYLAYHTLFWLDLYLSPSMEGFTPPAPFTLSELDPEGALPERAYAKGELLDYLQYGRRKCRAVIDGLAEERAHEPHRYGRRELGTFEALLYNLRHVQHGAAQLNLLLRQQGVEPPRWVAAAQ